GSTPAAPRNPQPSRAHASAVTANTSASFASTWSSARTSTTTQPHQPAGRSSPVRADAGPPDPSITARTAARRHLRSADRSRAPGGDHVQARTHNRRGGLSLRPTTSPGNAQAPATSGTGAPASRPQAEPLHTSPAAPAAQRRRRQRTPAHNRNPQAPPARRASVQAAHARSSRNGQTTVARHAQRARSSDKKEDQLSQGQRALVCRWM